MANFTGTCDNKGLLLYIYIHTLKIVNDVYLKV